MKKEMFPVPSSEENAFLNAYPFIRQTARRRLLRSHYEDSADDLSHRVALKLWSWNLHRRRRWEMLHLRDQDANSGDYLDSGVTIIENKHSLADSDCPLHELTTDEWCRLANVALRNELKTFFAAKDKKEIPLAEEMSAEGYFTAATEPAMNTQIEGNTSYELKSQLCEIWKASQNLSVREKYALLLKERRLVNYLIASGCCKIKDITAQLELTREEFIGIYKKMPLSNTSIAALLENKLRQSVSPMNVIKARQRAKKRIRLAITGEYKIEDYSGGRNNKSINDGRKALHQGKT